MRKENAVKLGLLTFHDAANYGAALQAYALQAFLEGEGFDCEYLDYRNERRRHMYDMGWHVADSLRRGDLASAAKYFLGAPFMQLRKRRFAAFRGAHLKVSSCEYRTSGELGAATGGYDKFVVGSDQVWNPFNNGADTAFLLDFLDDPHRKIAYSSSFGISEIPADLKEAYARCLNGMGRIAVRERAGSQLVKSLTGRDVPVVMDPVFLPGRGHWDALAGTKRRDETPFVFSYTNRGGQAEAFFRATRYSMQGKTLRKLARQTSPRDFVRRGVEVAYCLPPAEFVRNVRDAELVLTASFHCLSFAILFNKPFVCFLTGDAGKDERPAGLLQALGLEGRIFRSGMTLDEVKAPIDYGTVNGKLDDLVARSKSWLLDALKE